MASLFLRKITASSLKDYFELPIFQYSHFLLRVTIKALLLNNLMGTSQSVEDELTAACESNDLYKLNNVYEKFLYGTDYTLLHIAAREGFLPMVKTLVLIEGQFPNPVATSDPFGDTNIQNMSYITPLILARENGHDDIVDFLVDKVNTSVLGTILEDLSDCVLCLNSDGFVEGLNNSAELLLGYRKKEIIGLNVGEVLKCVELNEKWSVAHLRDMCGEEVEVAFAHKNSSVLEVLVTPSILKEGVILTIRKPKIAALRLLIKKMKDAAILADKDANILYVNPALTYLLGYTPEDLVGKPSSVLIWHSHLVKRHAEYVTEYQNTKVTRFIGIPRAVVAKSKAGERMSVEITLSTFGVDHFVALFRRIREPKDVKRELIITNYDVHEGPSSGSGDNRYFPAHSGDGTTYEMGISSSHFIVPTCAKGDIEGLKFLVENADIDLNFLDDAGKTPLHYACLGHHLEVVKYLVSHGARIEIWDSDGNSPLDISKNLGYDDISYFIEEIINEDNYLSSVKPPDEYHPLENQNLKLSKMNVNSEELLFGDELGRGNFGVVYKGKWRFVDVAIKKMRIVKQNYANEFLKEAKLMLKLRPHPNIVSLLGICIDGRDSSIITEYLEGGPLDKMIYKRKDFTIGLALSIINDIAMGLAHLHRESTVHLDISSRNILLTGGTPVRAKLSDFGFSKIFKHAKVTEELSVGGIRWMSPEYLLSSKQLGDQDQEMSFENLKKVDVWSMGILCWEIFARDVPHKGKSVVSLVREIAVEKLTPVVTQITPSVVKEIQKRCWNLNPSARPSFEDIVALLKENDNLNVIEKEKLIPLP